jgi:hypothetical protein
MPDTKDIKMRKKCFLPPKALWSKEEISRQTDTHTHTHVCQRVQEVSAGLKWNRVGMESLHVAIRGVRLSHSMGRPGGA